MLVCTYTNVAVDNLVEGLAAAGVHPLRVGFGGKVKSTLLEHTLDYKLEIHPLRPTLDKVIRQEDEVSARIHELIKRRDEITAKWTAGGCSSDRLRTMKDNISSDIVAKGKTLGALRGRKYALQQEMLRDVIAKADVVR